MQGELNSDLYGPLQEEYETGKKDGKDFWIHKNRMSALSGNQTTSLELYLKENGITTLLLAGGFWLFSHFCGLIISMFQA